jgi:hypothetical protein
LTTRMTNYTSRFSKKTHFVGNKQNPLLLQTTPTKASHPRKRELKTPIGVVYVDNATTLGFQSPELQAWA